MAMRKVTITLPEELVEAVTQEASREGLPVSRFIARATERDLRILRGLAGVAAFEAVAGDLSDEELARARAVMAAADARASARRRPGSVA